MRDVLDSQLQQILQKLMQMGGTAESMIQLAVRGLLERDEAALAEVHEKERAVNALQIDVDEVVVSVIVQQQPVARDARFVLAASHAAGDLERIADQAVNVSQNAHFVLQSPPFEPLPDLAAMAAAVQRMTADGLAALVGRDVELAEKILLLEAEVDRYRDKLFRTLLREMITDPLTAQRSLSLVLVSRNLERIGDHATNIAEGVIYMVRGQDVRHRFDSPVSTHSAKDGASAAGPA